MNEERRQGPRREDGRGGPPQGNRSGRARGPQAGRGRSSGADTGGDRDRRKKRGGSPRGARRPDRARPEAARTAEQKAYDGPPLDDTITGRELDRAVRQQLSSLPERLASRVARHLVAAGHLIDTDPALAYQHTLAARARATRIAVVREACGEAAYEAGEYAAALAEFRAARRMNGAPDYLPMMADCERALGRPERALKIAQDRAVASLGQAGQVEMSIVEAGARRDRGELEAALRTLEAAPLHSRSRAPWLVRLRYAYADTLLAAGRRAEALEWFHRTAAIDGEGITDAAERLAELEGDPSTND